MRRIYLAGPDVFTPDPLSIGAHKKRICAQYGMAGVFPSDEVSLDPALPRRQQGLNLYDSIERTMRGCDGAIVNLTPYHGPSMDVGSAYELGFMKALGRPVFGYTNDARLFAERVVAFHGGKLATRKTGEREGPDGMALEEFDMVDNLMIEGGVTRSTGILIARAAGEAKRYSAMDAFEECVRFAAQWFARQA